MSGKGPGQQDSGSYPPPATHDNPQVVQGWEHTQWGFKDTERYSYIGKDDNTGEPQFLDYGGKQANAEADAAKGKK